MAELLKTAPPELCDVLTLRQQLAKSSVRKYQAMEKTVCEDGRARGMFQFYRRTNASQLVLMPAVRRFFVIYSSNWDLSFTHFDFAISNPEKHHQYNVKHCCNNACFNLIVSAR